MVLALWDVSTAAAAPVGQITEFTSDVSQPSGIAPGPDGSLWFTDEGNVAIGRITRSGTVTEFPGDLASTGGVPLQIAAGPDGNMWFTLGNTTPTIGRITPSGTITLFTAGLQGSGGLGGIAPGPDGNVWFIQGGATPAIGRITPSGTITEFSAGLNANSVPTEITPGPDGNLWFTDEGATPAIGQITPSGAITEFAVGNQPLGIATGPDGNIWFTDIGNGGPPAIGRLTPTGALTEFTAGLQGSSFPGEIAPGPDGNMWFTDLGATGAIGQISMSGTITEFSSGLQVTSIPDSITTGPDGNLWFTDVRGGIGQIGAGAHAASLVTPSVGGSGEQGTQQVCGGDSWAEWAGQEPVADAFGFDGYQWLRDGSAIAGQTAQTYTPTSSDVGHQLTCTVTVTYPLLNVTDSATSAPLTVVPSASGSTGVQGPTGPQGPSGTTGTTGVTGAAGAQGPAGKDGEVELVTCKPVTKTVVQHGKRVKVTQLQCSTKLVTGPVKFTTASVSGRATLSRAGVVYATGYVYTRRNASHTSLVAARALRRGRYTLTVTRHSKGRSVRVRSQITIA